MLGTVARLRGCYQPVFVPTGGAFDSHVMTLQRTEGSDAWLSGILVALPFVLGT